MMPRWWYDTSFINCLLSGLLIPASWLYQLLGWLRAKAAMSHCPALPALCIGNATVGGAGKTPATLALANYLTQLGHTPHIASRGYGSDAAENPSTIQVDSAHHTATQVGDEPLMMATHFPVWVGKSRATSIAAAKESGASMVLMDDGLQNPTIAKTASLLVIDGGFGIGNGRIFPAGPLRETLASALKRCCAVCIVGQDVAGCEAMVRERNSDIPIFHFAATTQLPDAAENAPLFAFAGLARPEKFFDGLRAIGANLIETKAFPDHHPYSEKDLAALINRARTAKLTLITTEKDVTKIPAALRSQVAVAGLTLQLAAGESDALHELLADHFPTT